MNVVVQSLKKKTKSSAIFSSFTPEKPEEDAPVITLSRQRILNEIISEVNSTPESQGLAFFATFPASERISSLGINSLLKSNRTLASTFRNLNFAVIEEHIDSQEELNDVMCIATSHLLGYPSSPDYSIVVVVAGLVDKDINTLLTRHGEINICSDLLEPFLPFPAPAFAKIPKVLLINTITLNSDPLDTSNLVVSSEGNFIVSCTNTSDRDITELVEVLNDELGNSQDSVEDVLTKIKKTNLFLILHDSILQPGQTSLPQS